MEKQVGNTTIVERTKKAPAKASRTKTSERLLDPAKANPVGRPFVEWLAGWSLQEKLAVVTHAAMLGTRTDLLYDGDLEGELVAACKAAVDEAAENGELSEEQERMLAHARILDQLPE